MGATNFVCEIDAITASDGYNALCQDATFEYGNDAYNGTISTCSFYGTTHTTGERYTKTSRKKAMDLVVKADYGRKWEARAIDCGVVNYRIDRLVKVPHTKADAIFQTVFSVMVTDERGREESKGDYKTQAEANKAIDSVLACYPHALSIEVVKRAKKVKGSSAVATRYERQSRTTKTKPKTLPKGTTLTEVHHYVYYGWAAC